MSVHTFPSGRKTGGLTRYQKTYNPKAVWLGRFLNRAALPPDLVQFDMSADAPDWLMSKMFANGPDPEAPAQIKDTGIGDCFWAAMVRCAALSALSAGVTLFANYQDALAAALKGYSECTGWNINDPSTDQGTDPNQAWPYLQSTGLLCSDGHYEKLVGAVQVNYGDLAEVQVAFSLCPVLAWGVDLPWAWEQATVLDDTTSGIVSGHEGCIYSNLAVKGGILAPDWWGEKLVVTAAGFTKFTNRLSALVWNHSFGAGTANIAGFDQQSLLQALAAVQA